jgi:flagellar hook-associated protein 3 FlgL
VERITSLMTSQTTIYDLGSALDRLNKTQAQLSSGKRITQPSDDPYGTSLAMQLNGQLSGLTSYDRSVNDGTAWTQATDSSLMNINDVVQRVRELVVGAANGTNSQANLSADAAEVDQLTEAVKQSANATYDGQAIFSGTSGVQPYQGQGATGDVYQGNSGTGATVTRQIGPGATNNVQINTDISQLLGNGQTGPTGPDGKLLDVLRQVSQNLRSGNSTALGANLTSIDSNLTTLQGLEASVGATESRLTLASSRIQDLQLSTTQQLSNTQDVDMASAAISFATEQAAYTAALQASAKIVQSSLLQFLQ